MKHIPLIPKIEMALIIAANIECNRTGGKPLLPHLTDNWSKSIRRHILQSEFFEMNELVEVNFN